MYSSIVSQVEELGSGGTNHTPRSSFAPLICARFRVAGGGAKSTPRSWCSLLRRRRRMELHSPALHPLLVLQIMMALLVLTLQYFTDIAYTR